MSPYCSLYSRYAIRSIKISRQSDRDPVICYAGINTCLQCSCHLLHLFALPTPCDCFHDTTVRALTPVDVALEIRTINPSKTIIQDSWFVLHYTILLPDSLLYTTMTAVRVLIIFMIIIHVRYSDQQKRRSYMCATVHPVSVKSLSVSVILCVCR